MPGSGKSTIGVMLAKRLSYGFVDTDILIQISEHRPLQDIVDSDGYMALRKIEESIILDLNCHRQVVATGGSAVYSQKAAMHLQELGTIVFLNVNIDTLLSRITDMKTRGIARRPDQSFDDLFAERSALYKKYAEITIECSVLNHEEVCERIEENLRKRL